MHWTEFLQTAKQKHLKITLRGNICPDIFEHMFLHRYKTLTGGTAYHVIRTDCSAGTVRH